jgi:acetoin utilization protein AcuB
MVGAMTAPVPIPRRVRDLMSQQPKTVTPATQVLEAVSLMTEGGFRHLVVVEGGAVVGMLSDRDILRQMPPPHRASPAEQGKFSTDEVRVLMTRPAITIGLDEPIEAAVDVMLAEHIGALPVIDAAQRLVGVITLVDLARFAGMLIRSLPV